MPFFGFDGSSRGATREMHRGCDPLIDAVGIHLSARAEGAEQARLCFRFYGGTGPSHGKGSREPLRW
jgi:hypothetical protein